MLFSVDSGSAHVVDIESQKGRYGRVSGTSMHEMDSFLLLLSHNLPSPGSVPYGWILWSSWSVEQAVNLKKKT